MRSLNFKIAVVIPCYKVRDHIIKVIEHIDPVVNKIYVVDDGCPEETGTFVQKHIVDSRIQVLKKPFNQGVGAAVILGYQAALADQMDIVVKMDGDGQMDGGSIPNLIRPILRGEADYTKGNRFFNLEDLCSMPKIRIVGNALLSFITKFSSGYWDIVDPTNGFTAIHTDIIRLLPLSKISRRYFFESDMLFRLNVLRAVVVDVSICARYGQEKSNLKIPKIMGEFFIKNLRNFFKRIFYNYYLRDMSVASIELPIGVALFIFGLVFGGYHWILSALNGVASTAGTVMLSALPMLMGLQLILAFFTQDLYAIPRYPISRIKVTSRSPHE